MDSELRKSGVSVVGDIPWGTHFCYFYETKQDLLDVLIPYFKTGLEHKEFCLWVIATSELLTVEEATRALHNAVPDLDRYLAENSIEIVGHRDWFLNGDAFDPDRVADQFNKKLHEALARGYAGMRVNGSPAWLVDAGQKELRKFEAQLDQLFPEERTIASCTYPLSTIGGDEVFDVVRSHRFAIARRQGEWEVVETPELIQAKAEIGRLNDVLRRISEGTPKPPVTLTYGVAVLSVIAALALALWLRAQVGQTSTPIVALFLCAVTVSAWFGGARPGLLALALSILSFDYFFLPPIYSFAVEIREIPRLIIFLLAGFLVGLLSVAQRRSAESLRHARDVLDGTIQELKRTNVALQAENAERKAAETLLQAKERALAESQHLLEEAQRIAHVGHYEHDLETDVIIASDENYRILGLEPQETITMSKVFELIHPEDRARVDRVRSEAVRTGQHFDVEYRMVRPDGEMRFIRAHGDVIRDEEGRARKTFGVAQDITERKQAEDAVRKSEDYLRLAIDTTPMMAWSMQPDGVVDFLNQRWIDYTGLPLEEYIKDPTGPVHPEDIPRVMEHWLVSKAAGTEWEEELRLRRADGKYRWFLVRTAPLKDEQGNVVKWYGVSVDIEDRKRTEDRLKATTKHLRALSARFQSAKDEEGARIAREIHDELGAVLTSLRWDLEGFDKLISESAESRPDELRSRIGDMLELIESAVSTVRRISSELRPTVLDDLGLTAAIEWQAQEFQARTGIACNCDCSAENFDLDREQATAVFRIFQEALTNILRHAQATQIDIETKAEAGEFVLTIRDNGRGITEAEKSASRSLGLLGMHERAHLVGGSIDITAVEGKGTVITVQVPMSEH